MKGHDTRLKGRREMPFLETMRPAQETLMALVERIFEDGKVTPFERRELVALYRDASLTVREAKEVYYAFVAKVLDESLADGVLSDEERQKLVTIVRELRLPDDCLPDLVVKLLAA